MDLSAYFRRLGYTPRPWLPPHDRADPVHAPVLRRVALGHFADKGLDVTMMPAAEFGNGTIQALLDGDIEVSLGGLM